MTQTILLLGDERLYDISTPYEKEDLDTIKGVVQDLHDTMMAFRKTYGVGRAIAAPQIGIPKRLIYMNIDHPVPMINPILTFIGDETMLVLDDCMSFPNLLVKVLRFKRCRIDYVDMAWKPQTLMLEDDLSELLQHEYDHLDGILATMRAIDDKAFVMKASR